jgi:hypothetical protein
VSVSERVAQGRASTERAAGLLSAAVERIKARDKSKQAGSKQLP